MPVREPEDGEVPLLQRDGSVADVAPGQRPGEPEFDVAFELPRLELRNDPKVVCRCNEIGRRAATLLNADGEESSGFELITDSSAFSNECFGVVGGPDVARGKGPDATDILNFVGGRVVHAEENAIKVWRGCGNVEENVTIFDPRVAMGFPFGGGQDG